jgi:hypothetical protein
MAGDGVWTRKIGRMKTPWIAGRLLTPEEFDCYCKQAMRVYRRGGIRLQDYKEVLLDFPLLMKPGEWPRLARLAEKLTQELLTAERELLLRPDLYPLLGLAPVIERVLHSCGADGRTASGPRIMRFDFYHTTDGWRFSEANPDTPGGYVEAYGYTEPMVMYYPGYSPPPNPAAVHAEAIRKSVGKGAQVAVVLAGEDPYGMRQVEFLMKEIEVRGVRGIIATIGRLRWGSGVARVVRSSSTGTPSLIVRQITVEKMLKLTRSSHWAHWFCGRRTPVSNPCYSILIESKRFPCVLKELDAPMPAYRSHSPESRFPTEISPSSQNQWVFKPAFGVAGRGVAIAGVTRKLAFKAAAEVSRRHPMNWVAQRRFESVAVPTERGPGHVCLGIYTVDGSAAGAYARIRGTALIDKHALSIPVLIPERDLAVAAIRTKTAVS